MIHIYTYIESSTWINWNGSRLFWDQPFGLKSSCLQAHTVKQAILCVIIATLSPDLNKCGESFRLLVYVLSVTFSDILLTVTNIFHPFVLYIWIVEWNKLHRQVVLSIIHEWNITRWLIRDNILFWMTRINIILIWDWCFILIPVIICLMIKDSRFM